MTAYGRILLAGAGSAALLLGALGFQFLGGLAPCPMCIWQRWPHVAAVVLAVLAVTVLWRQRRWLAALGAAAMLVSTGLGIFHAGVEWQWWQGPVTCTAGDITRLSADELMTQILGAPLVRCDEIVWELFGITMAGWNALFSLGLAALWAASVVWWRMPFAGATRD
ncbi:MAG: disulfide bond formation protein B [Thermohalobaculum sp.]|nr:disulfide bond formation protein B [Thermohalobaculum sp.]